MIYPTIHPNGTTKERLLEALCCSWPTVGRRGLRQAFEGIYWEGEV